MAINDKFKDGKLKYDFNREAAKISALSYRKIEKYEYLTGEEIIPSDQCRIIEQTKFTYSLLGISFEKQIKTIKDQYEKQIKSLEEHRKSLPKCNDEKSLTDSDQKKSSTSSKQKEIFDEFANERLKEIHNLSKQLDFNNLTYHYKGKIPSKRFITFKRPLNFYNTVREGYITLEKSEEEQKEFKHEINDIVRGKNKTVGKIYVINNIITNREKKLSNCLMIILES